MDLTGVSTQRLEGGRFPGEVKYTSSHGTSRVRVKAVEYSRVDFARILHFLVHLTHDRVVLR